jgi:UTP--glucose-1-phosphate uridylyltransferase
MTKIRKAIIPAAGLGTRFLPATKALPKEMMPIVDKPAIQYIGEEAVASGIESILIVTGRNKRAIEDYFDKSGELESFLEEKGKYDLLEIVKSTANLADIHYIRQKEPLGLGHAILCARHFIGDEPFAVLLGDDIIHSEPPALQSMVDLYHRHARPVVAVQEVDWSDVHKYGIVSHTEGLIDQIVEKPAREQAPSNLAVIGRYVLTPDIFPILEHTEPGKGGEIQLTDALNVLNATEKMKAFTVQGKRYDIGDHAGYLEASLEFALRRDDIRPRLQEHILRLAESLTVREGGR